MERVLLDEVIDTDYGQFDVVWSDAGGFDGDYDKFFAGQSNGWVGAGDPNGVYVNLARRFGGSRVRIVLLDTPPDQGPGPWEDVVEVSVVISPHATVLWRAWGLESSGPLNGLTPGPYRVRVSARGRDRARADVSSEGPPDEYLMPLWGADPEPDQNRPDDKRGCGVLASRVGLPTLTARALICRRYGASLVGGHPVMPQFAPRPHADVGEAPSPLSEACMIIS